MEAVLVWRGLSPADAAVVAEALLDTSLRGIDTHGIALLPNYVELLAKGITRPRPDVSIDAHGALLRVDADRGLGQVVVSHVLKASIERTREFGSVTAVVSNVGHLGALGFFARRAAEAGMVALVLQNGPPLMGLPGSTARAIGNNPLAFGAPLAGRPPILFDVATSEAALGKIAGAAGRGEAIPEGWALDKAGHPTTDATAALDGILLPAGGAKGVGIAMLVDVLAGSLGATRPPAGGNLFGAFLLVVDPAQCHPGYAADMEDWIETYARSGPDARYPGERSDEIAYRRRRDGIPAERVTIDRFIRLGQAAGIAFPIE